MKIDRIRPFRAAVWMLPVIGACWVGAAHGSGIDSTTSSSIIGATGLKSCRHVSVPTLVDIYARQVLADNHLLNLISLERERVRTSHEVRLSVSCTAASPTGVDHQSCMQVVGSLRRLRCEDALRRVQQWIQQIDLLSMPGF